MSQINEQQSNLIDNNQIKFELKTYRKRWLIIFIFMVYSGLNAFQWIQYSIITNIIMRYYSIDSMTVDWTTIIFMALYPPLILPAIYIIDLKGLRIAALIGGLGTALGAIIKLFSINPNAFYIVLIGQTISAIAQLFIFPIPSEIAAVWFQSNEVSTACALCFFGYLTGYGLGYVIPPNMVRNHQNLNDIGDDLRNLSWILTAISVITALTIIVYFSNEPPLAPSVSQAIKRRNKIEKNNFFESLKLLFKNGAFLAHCLVYGINIGVSSAVNTLLNQFILKYFDNAEQDAGRMGLLMVVAGTISSVIFGIFLDKTHKYKATCFTLYLVSSLSVIAFMFALNLKSLILAYVSISIFGVCTLGYWSVSYELAIELTYPISEGTTNGLLMVPSQIFGVILTLALGQLNRIIGPFWALSSQAGLLILGTIITGLIPNLTRRQDALKAEQNDDSIRANLGVKN